MEAEHRLELIRSSQQMRLVRWLLVPFTLAQFILYQAPPGLKEPFDPLTMAIVVAVMVVALNLGSIASMRIEKAETLRWVGATELVADTLIVLGVVWLYAFDHQSALWALLVLPILEGAIRAGIAGALATWGLCAVGYLAREVFAIPEDFALESYTYRMGILAVVAAATGSLAKNLESRAVDHHDARRESDRRAELLRIVAGASRKMSTIETSSVFETLVDAGAELGFDTATVVILDDDQRTYHPEAIRGAPQGIEARERDASVGVVGRVRTTLETVVIDDYSGWSEGVPDARELGFKAVVGCPLFVNNVLEGVVVVGTRERTQISRHELECLELLSAHAGASLTTARHFTERRALQEQLHHEAFHDSLTGLANRTLFLDRLDHCIERKAKTPSPTAVLFIDLDRFKNVNDSLGSEAGDEVLQIVTERIQEIRGRGDTIARYGGVQFAILIEEPESQQHVMDTANRIVKRLQEPFTIEGTDVYISASIGVSFRYQAEGHARDFLREADLAMHRAKEQGGGRSEAYRPVMSTRAKHRMDMERELRRALENDELRVHYQPAVSLSTGRVVGLEALARWQHPERGLIAAGEFMPLAEESGLIGRIGQRVLDEVTAQISVWRATGALDGIPVSVNLSASEFAQQDFVERVTSVLDAHKLHPRDLIFEVTESVVMRDDAATLTQMRKLERIGIRLAIDDFGLGYSSLNYLKRFRFSVLKIDKSFVTDVASRETDQAIVRYVVGLANDLKIPAVAEGVETPEQMEYLRSVGCQFVQGYYLCRPVDPISLIEFVRSTTNGDGQGETSPEPDAEVTLSS